MSEGEDKKRVDIQKRAFLFGCQMIDFYRCLAKHNGVGKVLGKQILRSGTSIGANYREANRARSKADFKNKMHICEGEASETQYWLEVIVKVKWLTWAKIKWEYEECGELLGIFTTAANK